MEFVITNAFNFGDVIMFQGMMFNPNEVRITPNFSKYLIQTRNVIYSNAFVYMDVHHDYIVYFKFRRTIRGCLYI